MTWQIGPLDASPTGDARCSLLSWARGTILLGQEAWGKINSRRQCCWWNRCAAETLVLLGAPYLCCVKCPNPWYYIANLQTKCSSCWIVLFFKCPSKFLKLCRNKINSILSVFPRIPNLKFGCEKNKYALIFNIIYIKSLPNSKQRIKQTIWSQGFPLMLKHLRELPGNGRSTFLHPHACALLRIMALGTWQLSTALLNALLSAMSSAFKDLWRAPPR